MAIQRCQRGFGVMITVPLGEPEDYGWFRQEDVRGWSGFPMPSIFALMSPSASSRWRRTRPSG